MPLFLCPNDNNEMQKINRDGDELDVCPTCKGVWLDRGELDKLLNLQREAVESQKQSEARFHKEVDDFRRDPDEWRRAHPYDEKQGRYRYDDDDDDRGDRDERYRKGGRRRRGFDITDIFDF